MRMAPPSKGKRERAGKTRRWRPRALLRPPATSRRKLKTGRGELKPRAGRASPRLAAYLDFDRARLGLFPLGHGQRQDAVLVGSLAPGAVHGRGEHERACEDAVASLAAHAVGAFLLALRLALRLEREGVSLELHLDRLGVMPR